MSFDLTSLGTSFVTKDSTADDSTIKQAEFVGIYFSAHWCPPCRGFTPKLAEFYNSANAGSKRLEIVFVSSDRTEDSFKEYLNEMPWMALPFDNKTLIQELKQHFKVSGIPSFHIMNKNGEEMTSDGRGLVMKGLSKDVQQALDKLGQPVEKFTYTEEIKGGKTIKIKTHEHEVKYSTNEDRMKVHHAYQGGWQCNECGRYGPPQEANLQCGECQYDLCDQCVELDS